MQCPECTGVDIGDKILFIDRQTVAGLSLSQVGARMAGPEGLSFFFFCVAAVGSGNRVHAPPNL